MSKLFIIEEGEYSDFQYYPLVLSDDFDLTEAASAYKREALKDDPKPYTIDLQFHSFLVKEYGARDPDKNEELIWSGVVDDPIRYGCWKYHSVFWDDL